MSKHLVSTLIFLLTAVSILAESPVDAPGQIKATVTAEISRGFSNISDFAREHPDLRFAILASRLRRRSLTQVGNSDSPGFTLGARLAELACLDALMRSDQGHGKNSVSDTNAATAQARELYLDVRSRERALGLKDSDLLLAIGEPHSTGIPDLLSRYDAMAAPGTPAASPAPPPTSSPAAFSSPPPPEFVRLTSKTTLRDAKGRDVKTLERGHRLRVAARTETEVTVYYWSEKFPIPAASTEPSE
jgi:hypothetical protein